MGKKGKKGFRDDYGSILEEKLRLSITKDVVKELHRKYTLIGLGVSIIVASIGFFGVSNYIKGEIKTQVKEKIGIELTKKVTLMTNKMNDKLDNSLKKITEEGKVSLKDTILEMQKNIESEKIQLAQSRKEYSLAMENEVKNFKELVIKKISKELDLTLSSVKSTLKQRKSNFNQSKIKYAVILTDVNNKSDANAFIEKYKELLSPMGIKNSIRRCTGQGKTVVAISKGLSEDDVTKVVLLLGTQTTPSKYKFDLFYQNYLCHTDFF